MIEQLLVADRRLEELLVLRNPFLEVERLECRMLEHGAVSCAHHFFQGESVLATRRPKLLIRKANMPLKRTAARTYLALLYQEPPRTARRMQSPEVQASPVADAPL